MSPSLGEAHQAVQFKFGGKAAPIFVIVLLFGFGLAFPLHLFCTFL